MIDSNVSMQQNRLNNDIHKMSLLLTVKLFLAGCIYFQMNCLWGQFSLLFFGDIWYSNPMFGNGGFSFIWTEFY